MYTVTGSRWALIMIESRGKNLMEVYLYPARLHVGQFRFKLCTVLTMLADKPAISGHQQSVMLIQSVHWTRQSCRKSSSSRAPDQSRISVNSTIKTSKCKHFRFIIKMVHLHVVLVICNRRLCNVIW
jgi:hypothetical protein